MHTHRLVIALGVVAALFAGAGSAAAATWSVAYPPYPAGASVPFAPLYSVSAISATDVWTVGESSGVPLLDRWNGRAWTRSSLPAGPCSAVESDCVLTGVSGDAAGDVFAVGDGIVNSGSGWLATPLAFHYNGSAWSPVALPSGIPYESVQHVAAFSPTDAWAVGVGATATGSTVATLQWNGGTWTQVQTPYSTVNDLTVGAISGSSPSDIWVVGQTVTPGYHNRQFTSVVLHYNGTSWQQQSVPDASGLLDVDALSPTDAWAVAADGSILNWNGSSWTVRTSESGAERIAAVSATDVWVGGIVSIGHFNGSAWSTTATPSSFNGVEGAASLTPGQIWFAGYFYKPGTTEVAAMLSTANG